MEQEPLTNSRNIVSSVMHRLPGKSISSCASSHARARDSHRKEAFLVDNTRSRRFCLSCTAHVKLDAFRSFVQQFASLETVETITWSK
eukprot:3593662-Amphidinium_carterae.1